MFTITVNTGYEKISKDFENSILLSDALDIMGITHHKPCGGRGVCGKCKATISGKDVLCCKTYINENSYVNYNIRNSFVQGVSVGIMPPVDLNPLVQKGYGASIDIGTTTIAASIYKFPGGECVYHGALPNTQSKYGADVISRIMHSGENGVSALKDETEKQIKKLTDGYNIEKYVITGNTTMLHFLTGKNASGIAVAPYTPQSLFGNWHGNIYLPHCISSYVGADITCAIIASEMTRHKTALMVDVGTNGEMVLWHNGKFICCSTAAGPAFEGAGITNGCMATNGAINKVYVENGKVKYTTIGNEKPIGICGTGLIDAIASMLELYIPDEGGYIEDDFEIGESGIYITLEDVRRFQLAKSAIRAGIDTLIHNAKINYDDIEVFYIAGGFGSFINPKNGAKTGMIPKQLKDKCVPLGNSALCGASMMLLDKDYITKAQKIINSATTLDLMSDSYFTQKYIDNMGFYND